MRRRISSVPGILASFAVLSLLFAPAAFGDRTVELRQRRSALAEGDGAGRCELAAWAAKRGMVQEARKLYREALAIEPSNATAYRSLWTLVDQRPLSSESKAIETTIAALGRGFRRSETAHYVIFSSAGEKWTRGQRTRLERAYSQFMRVSRDLGLEPLPLEHKLVCVLFKDRKAFVRFAQEHDGMRSGWSYGYYAPAKDRIVLFNGEREKGADEFARKRTLATTVHEAVHQLQFHTKVQNKHVQYPLWINEGMATAYETDSPRGPFGPDHAFKPRQDRMDEVLRRDEQIPLRVLVQMDRLPGGVAEVGAVYSQSYALVSWLASNRRDGLRRYFAAMRTEPPGRPRARRHLELFQQAFGDVAAIERAWLADQRKRFASTAADRNLASR